MKGLGLAFATLCVLPAACEGQSQTALPKLSDATAVDIRVSSVRWQPFGDALLYARDEDSGTGIGLYRASDSEGKVVLHLGKDDSWRSEWFSGCPFALVFVTRKVQAGWGSAKEGDVYLLDANQKTSYKVFSRIVHPKDELSIDAKLSPSLLHAVFTVHEGSSLYYAVLPNNGGRLVLSPDIDEAVKEGFAGPGWSVDGTATYAKSGSNGQDRGQTDVDPAETRTLQQYVARTTDETVRLLLDARMALAEWAATTPPAGTPVLEVVPSNGTLRQVRSPGPWKWRKEGQADLFSTKQALWLTYGRSRSLADSIWLSDSPVPADPVRNPDAEGVMVAAHADSATIAPDDQAVAYVVDGALFVRQIEKGTPSVARESPDSCE